MKIDGRDSVMFMFFTFPSSGALAECTTHYNGFFCDFVKIFIMSVSMGRSVGLFRTILLFNFLGFLHVTFAGNMEKLECPQYF